MSEASHDEAQPEDKLQEQRSPPLVQSLTYGTGTFLAVGAVDLLAHLGPTGLVVGGIAAWVASQHGPQLASRVREALPSPDSPSACGKTRTAPSQPRGDQGTRSLLDRALGRFAAEEDTVVVEEPEAPLVAPSRQTRR